MNWQNLENDEQKDLFCDFPQRCDKEYLERFGKTREQWCFEVAKSCDFALKQLLKYGGDSYKTGLKNFINELLENELLNRGE